LAEADVKLIGIVLIVVGVLALAVGGINYTTQKKILDIGPLQATTDEHHSIPLSPIVGIAALIGGAVLVVSGGRARA
jgi:uncharacterized membrane protein YidH (DUF202 family)